MIYGKLVSYKSKMRLHKGESYQRFELTFKILWFKKTIIQDLTMFNDWKTYKEHWDYLIENKCKIPYKEIKSKIIF